MEIFVLPGIRFARGGALQSPDLPQRRMETQEAGVDRIAMKPPSLIVFDMDGVIIDVSDSYREAVRKAARIFFRGAKGFNSLPEPLFPLPDLARLKQSGGLNNDWELTAQVISLLLTLVKIPLLPELSDAWSHHEGTVCRCDVSNLAEFLTAAPTPLAELLKRFGKRTEPFAVECFRGDVGSGNIIKQIFQEIYLGQTLFSEIYGLVPRFHRAEGLINRERLLIDRALLESLALRNTLAVATGRPRVEADYPLDRFSLRTYFPLIVTNDDCVREEERHFRESGVRRSFGKPNPFMLDLIHRLIGKEFAGCYYLGDMPDDMRAAASSQAGYRGVGVVLSSPDRESLSHALVQAGADHIIDDYSVLPDLIG
jgi:HAD superfamily phosphatase